MSAFQVLCLIITSQYKEMSLEPKQIAYMENKIVKVSPELKRRICNASEIDWCDISVVLFESDGVLLYLKEYGSQIKIKYNEIIRE